MSDGYTPDTDHDHGHYDDPNQHDGQSIHEHEHDSSTLTYDHDRDTYLERGGDHDGYLNDDDDRHVVIVDETVEVHDLHTVETQDEGRLELVEYDSVHVEHVEQVVVVDDDGRVLDVQGDDDGGRLGHVEGDQDFDGRGQVDYSHPEDLSGHGTGHGTTHTGGHYDSPDASPYAKN